MRVVPTAQMPLASSMLRREAIAANESINVLVVSSRRPQTDATKDSRETHLRCNSDTQRLDGPAAMMAWHGESLRALAASHISSWHISESETALLIGQSDDLAWVAEAMPPPRVASDLRDQLVVGTSISPA